MNLGLFIHGACLGSLGAYAQALDLTRQGVAIADEIDHLQWQAGSRWTLGAILLDILCFAQAQEQLEQARTLALASGSMHWKMNTTGLLGVALVSEGNLERAAAVLADVLPADGPFHTQGRRCVWRGWVALALARGEADVALRLIDHVIATTPRAERGIPSVLQLRATALAALGRLEEAEADARRAHSLALTEELKGVVWRAGICLGNAMRAQKRMTEAEAAFREARGVIAQIAAGLPDPDLRATFQREAEALLPREESPARRAEAERFGGLTAREREVAALVAKGKSNRSIAGDLILSERTVETHVTNILLKLGYTSRAQIAAWAARMGLLSHP